MGRAVNKVILLGYVQPKEPEMRFTTGGQPVCSLRLVTNEDYKDRDGKLVEQSEWHNLTVWGKKAEIISQYVHKGDRLYIEGRIRTRRWEDQGQPRYSTEIVVDEFTLLGGAAGERRAEAPVAVDSGGRDNSSDAGGDDGMPF